jgi:poly-gamma-glutamate capsule biosynthesis protein CapA/YwtB (metallophosphatase superfamily)
MLWVVRGLLFLAAWIGACAPAGPPSVERSQSSTAAAPMPSAIATSRTPARVVLIAGGDVDLARIRGKMLLADPNRDDLAPVKWLLDGGDLRFANLESTISDQRGETERPWNKRVFTAPPAAAAALRHARIDIVSLANNHAWDYGEAALYETFEHLDRAGIAWVGAGKSRDEAYAPRIVERNGMKLAFVAVTAVWNQPLEPHPGKERIANADREALVAAVRRARAIDGVDAVIVSHHGGEEFVDEPLPGTRDLLRAALEAGADVVIGHHPHVIQRAAFRNGKPILYSVGNLLMRMVTGQPWTEFGMLARIEIERGAATRLSICPFRIFGLELVPLAKDPQRSMYEAHFRQRFERMLERGALFEPDAGASLGEFDADGCAPLVPR